MPRARPFQKGRKRLQFSNHRAISSGNGGSPCWRAFGRNSSSSISPTPRTFSIGRILVLPVDFLDYFCFQEFELGRRVLGRREEERLSCEARRLHPVLPRDLFSFADLVLPVDFLVGPFQELEPRRRVLWGRDEKRILPRSSPPAHRTPFSPVLRTFRQTSTFSTWPFDLLVGFRMVRTWSTSSART